MAHRTALSVPVVRFEAGASGWSIPLLFPAHVCLGTGDHAAALVARAVEELHDRDQDAEITQLLP